MSTFAEFGLPPVLIESLDALAFQSPTPIQLKAIPPAMEGKDILAIAPTGTGKTGAFGIPSLAFLHGQMGKQVLILAPTRELAAQIHKFLRKLGEPFHLNGTLIVGGESFYRQRCEVKQGVDYIVATPGRLMDHIERGMPIENISVLVLDEVDRMLDMGFAPQIKQIVEQIPQERQTYLFSATLPKEISKLADKFLKNPVRINILGNPADKPKIQEEKIQTNDVEKPRHLIDQVEARQGKILVFANTQGRVEQVARRLEHAGQPAASIHGGRTHGERKYALESFRTGRVRILVATDIVARGIDVADIEHVINYDYPETEEDYLHRIGRTGRFGKEGQAVTFVDEMRHKRSLRRQRFSQGRDAGRSPRQMGSGERPRSRAFGDRRPAAAPHGRERSFSKPFSKPFGERPERPRFERNFEKPAFERSERPAERAPQRFSEERPARFDRSAPSDNRRPFRPAAGAGSENRRPFRPAREEGGRPGGFRSARPAEGRSDFRRGEGFRPDSRRSDGFRPEARHRDVPAKSKGIFAKAAPRSEDERRKSALSRVDKIFKPKAMPPRRDAKPDPEWVRGRSNTVRRRGAPGEAMAFDI